MSEPEHNHADEHVAHESHSMHSENMQHDASDHASHTAHAEDTMPEHAEHEAHTGQMSHESHAEQVAHTGHEQMFRTRFWISLVLSIPVLAFSPMIQKWMGFRIPSIPGGEWVPFLFSLVIFGYGGVPFLQMAVPEIRARRPGMMTLISLAISVAFAYSLLAQITGLGEGFFWELLNIE